MDLCTRLGIDALSSGLSAAAISPIIFMIDKSIMEATSGKSRSISHSIGKSARQLITTPLSFLGSVPFLLLYSVYFATYTTANAFDTISSRSSDTLSAWSTQTNGFGKFLATTAVNLSACVYKDMRYAKLYGSGQPRRTPSSTIMMFALRDSLTVFASFNVPSLIAPHYMPLNTAQLITPCIMQFVSTPLHLLGLDLYNRPKTTMSSRLSTVAGGYWKSSFARIGRILPAFGVGGVLNRELRQRGMGVLHRSSAQRTNVRAANIDHI